MAERRPTLKLDKRTARAVAGGHPWIYGDAVKAARLRRATKWTWWTASALPWGEASQTVPTSSPPVGQRFA